MRGLSVVGCVKRTVHVLKGTSSDRSAFYAHPTGYRRTAVRFTHLPKAADWGQFA